MDGPNVNLKFQKDLKKTLRKHQEKLFLRLTPVPSTKSFKKGVKMLPIDIDQFAVDLHGFIKLSSARREDYSNLQDLTEVTSQYVLHHSSVRWPTLKSVLVRIIEQWTNLTD